MQCIACSPYIFPRLFRSCKLAHLYRGLYGGMPVGKGGNNEKPTVRIELTTLALQVRCSTTELRRHTATIAWMSRGELVSGETLLAAYACQRRGVFHG